MNFTVFFYIFLATAFVSFLVSFLAWKRKKVHGAIELSRLMLFSGIYAFFISFEVSSTTLAEKIIWAKIAYVGAVAVPVLYFVFIMRYTGYEKVTSLKNTLLLFILPVITLILTYTNEKHHLVWTGFSPISPETNILKYYHGVWFWVGYLAYDYILLFFATISLFNFIIRYKKTFRLQGWVIFVAGICPWACGIVYLTNANPIPGFDLAPASTMLSGILLIYAIARVGFLDLVPIARETLVETLEDGIIALDAKNRVQDINEAACVYLGLPDKSVLGLTVDSSGASSRLLLNAIISPESFEQFDMEEDKQGKKTLKITKQNITKEPGSRLIVIRDISDQIAKQVEIRAGEERYRKMYNVFRLMADNMSDMLWAKDLNKNFIFVNKAICDDLLKASDTDEPIGKTDLFFMEREQQKHPERADWHNIESTSPDSDEKVIRSGKPEHFDEFGNVSGEFLFMDVRKAPIFDEEGKMIGVVGSARDVTLQKKIESDINRRDKLLNAITSATNLLIQGDDLEYSMHGCLEIIGNATGINRISIYRSLLDAGTGIPILNFIYEWTDGLAVSQGKKGDISYASLQYAFPNWFDRLSQGKVCLGKANDFSQSERSILTLQNIKSVLVAPVFIDKIFWGFIGFDDCFCEREWTSTEERLLTATANTIASVYVRKKNQEELLAAKKKAEESDRLKSAFLANMSHEIRTPMNSILGFISLLQDPNLTGEERNEYFSIVKKGGERLLNTIHDIIDISKIESGEMMVTNQELDINEMNHNLHNLFRPEAEAKGLIFNQPVKLLKEQALVKTDRNKVYSVMTNLIKNALKYTKKGSIEMGCLREPDHVLFYVKDTGIGVSVDKRQVIFERFVQADVSNTRSYEGAGLGLSISKAYVEMLGGKIWVESVVNQGSIFYFQMPVSELAIVTVKSVSDESVTRKHEHMPLTILVVEDDQASFEYVNTILKKEKHKIIHVISGLEAVVHCRQNPDLDIVLMDVKLLDIDGYEATRRIRTYNKEIPIVAVSAFAFQEDREKALECGCDGYVSKPLKKEFLLAIINKYSKH